jgi:hypothetical protein
MSEQQEKKRGMLEDLAQARAEIHGAVVSEEALPAGSAPLEELAVEAAPAVVTEEIVAEKVAEKKKIKIAGREFDSQDEAYQYAEELDRERMIAEARNEGLREAIHAVGKKDEPVVEENNEFDEFYTNPQGYMAKVKEQAKSEIRQELDAHSAEEAAWREFCDINPDLADSRPEVIRIMKENWDVLGKMRDREKAIKYLAAKTRNYFDKIVEMRMPRKELPNSGGQVVSPSGSLTRSVTQQKKPDAPLTLAQQMKSLRKGM